MILVIGGAFQGKRQVCCRLLHMDESEFQDRLADGQRDEPEQALEKPYVAAFHEFLKKAVSLGMDPEAYTMDVLAMQPKIISIDEVGCGIVPVDRRDRDYRETVGRCGQLLAAGAEAVYRVVCGIPSRIK